MSGRRTVPCRRLQGADEGHWRCEDFGAASPRGAADMSLHALCGRGNGFGGPCFGAVAVGVLSCCALRGWRRRGVAVGPFGASIARATALRRYDAPPATEIPLAALPQLGCQASGRSLGAAGGANRGAARPYVLGGRHPPLTFRTATHAHHTPCGFISCISFP